MSEKFKIVIGYVIISLIWGSTWLAIRLGLDSLTPLIASGLRFITASVLIYVFMKYMKVSLQLDSVSIKIYFFLGIFSYYIPFGLVYWGEQYVPSGLASVIFAIFPFMVMFFSKLALKSEIIDRNKFIGVISGFVGIYLIFSDDLTFDFSNYLWGMLAVLGSATLQAFSAVAIKKYGKHLNPISMNFLPVTIGGILLLASGVLFEDLSKIKIDGKAVASILYLALFGTLVTFTIYYWLLKKINIVILSLSSFITPIIAVFLGWLLLNESLQKNDIYGSLFVLLGLVFANLSGLKKYFTKTMKVKRWE